ncbi:dynactin p62 family-domain-containing protein, partial [Mycena filopes]
MPPTVDYHCPCLSQSIVPPPNLPSSSHCLQALNTLFFCEECDAVRCNRCVSVEVSSHYCPNCLFEAPSASIHTEGNRCGRNCFLCPNCQNTLSVVPSDPPDPGDNRLAFPINAVGEPPFSLYCNHCRWDSTEVDIAFENVRDIADLEQQWTNNSWVTSVQTADLKPRRIPLHSKQSKRCPTCTRILIEPERKAQSVQYKTKLMASNYLPTITATLPHEREASAETAKRALDNSTPDGGIYAGKTYTFHLALVNPLYDSIQVQLSVERVHAAAALSSAPASPEKAPFAVLLPSSSFPIAAFAEAYAGDEEDVFRLDDNDEGRALGREEDSPGKAGVLKTKGNVTVVGGEVFIDKEARGNAKFEMLVSCTYPSDDPKSSESDDDGGTPSKAVVGKPPAFGFYTVVDLGPIIPNE